MNKILMSGNKAVARGAYEAGVVVSAAYPGTPSTEISECISNYDSISSEWSVNEKVAYEVALGAAFSGKRAMVSMKSVGLNVACDPMFTSSYTGILAGLVVVVVDDPGMHSSQNEQDTRLLARAAGLPVLEPADSQEAKDYTKLAFEISEEYDTPVVIRMTMRTSHSSSPVLCGPRVEKSFVYEKRTEKNVMLPCFARARHVDVIERLRRLSTGQNVYELNTLEPGETSIGIISSGICYQYVKTAFPSASVLKLGMVYPLDIELIREFSYKVDIVYVIEELTPFLWELIIKEGISVQKKNDTYEVGELGVHSVRDIIHDVNHKKMPIEAPIGNALTFCKGCPHQNTFEVLRDLKKHVAGDIGCYTLGALEPFKAIDLTVCMGAGLSMLHGIEKANGKEFIKNWVAVIGDSTFFHTGINALINLKYNGSTGTVLILDNATTAMTGHQDLPSTGITLSGSKGGKVSIFKLCKAIGIGDVTVIGSADKLMLKDTIEEKCKKEELTVVIVREPCIFCKKRED